MTDIIERLRNRALATEIIKDNPALYNDAADVIISLCDENEKLRERLAEADEANRRVSDENAELRAALKESRGE